MNKTFSDCSKNLKTKPRKKKFN